MVEQLRGEKELHLVLVSDGTQLHLGMSIYMFPTDCRTYGLNHSFDD